ncbi:hypothetical protein HNP00_000107 [Arthrobacter sp. AZCC_0090]|nr:hypothetical protein [Arthrobacter sp. AZCC_0090]
MESHTTIAHAADHPHHFMTGHYIRHPRRKVALGQMQIRPADTTGPDTDQQLFVPRLRIGPLAPNKWR